MRRRAFLLLIPLVLSLGMAGWWFSRPTHERCLAQGRKAIQAGDGEKVEACATQLEALGQPAKAALLRAEQLLARARGHLAAEERTLALTLLREALTQVDRIELNDDLRLDVATVAGQSLFLLGDRKAAEPLLFYVTEERPDDLDAQRALASLYYDLGAIHLALKHLAQVAQLAPEDGRPHRLMGLIHKDMEKFSEASEHYRQAIERFLPGQQWEEARQEFAEVLIRQSRFGEALPVLDQLGPTWQEREKILALRAECLANEGTREQTFACLKRGLSRYPRSAALLKIQGRLLGESGETVAATTALEAALETSPRDPEIRYQLARLYRQAGKTEQAAAQDRLAERDRTLLVRLNHLSGQAAGNPWDASLRRELASLCRELGRLELEQMWLRAADAIPVTPAAP